MLNLIRFSTVLLLFITFNAQGQKIKIKKDKVLVDKEEWAQLYKDNDVRFLKILANTKGDELLLVRLVSYNDPREVSKSNTDGSIVYRSIEDPSTGEILFESNRTLKKIMEMLYTNNVLNEDGTLNMENLNKLAAKVGKEFSRKREELN